MARKEKSAMNIQAIEQRQTMANIKFEAAKKIRAILDEVRKAYGPKAWDDEYMEIEVLELVAEQESS